MIDVHSHIIPLVDDGSKSFLVTEKMFKAAKDNGFAAIFATPHYFGAESICREDMVGHFEKIKEYAKEFDIDLYLGNEVYICPEIAGLVDNKIVSSMNDTRYVLIELPRNNAVNYLYDTIFELKSFDIVPIIAHPERYGFVIEDYKRLFKLAEAGALFQLNSGSLVGDYGSEVKNTAKTLLKHNIYQFMGSDAHSYDRYRAYNTAVEYLKKISGAETVKLLTETNPEKMLRNEDISTNIEYRKKKWFGR